MCHIDRLLRNDCETNNEKTDIDRGNSLVNRNSIAAVARQRPARNSGNTFESGIFFWSASRL
jgi:hypothetical protein